jgi:hypothetical protein
MNLHVRACAHSWHSPEGLDSDRILSAPRDNCSRAMRDASVCVAMFLVVSMCTRIVVNNSHSPGVVEEEVVEESWMMCDIRSHCCRLVRQYDASSVDTCRRWKRG